MLKKNVHAAQKPFRSAVAPSITAVILTILAKHYQLALAYLPVK